MRVHVELDEDGRAIRIFRTKKAADLSLAAELGRVEERERSEAVGQIRWQVFQASEGQCERCGCLITWRGFHMHEQITRGHGGEISVGNSIALCSRCHLGPDGVHQDHLPQF